MLNDLKTFLMKGNVIDLAVAVVIGAAFKKVVDSFVADIIMPPIGMLIGGVDFGDLKHVIQAATEDAEAITINYGSFIQSLVDFVIIGATIFVVVKAYEKMQKKEEAKPAKPPKQEVLLEEIRDLMKKKK